jgi:hypothetical protein
LALLLGARCARFGDAAVPDRRVLADLAVHVGSLQSLGERGMNFFQGVLSNSPSYSFGRFMSLVIACFCLGWDTSALIFAWKVNSFALHSHMIPGFNFLDLLPSGTALITQVGFMGAFYGATKYSDVKTGATGSTEVTKSDGTFPRQPEEEEHHHDER